MDLIGMCRHSGKYISGVACLKQAITDIITTPIGSRIERPTYGSHIPRMVDLPTTKGWMSAVQAEIHRAIAVSDPNLLRYFKPGRVTVTAVLEGKVHLQIACEIKNQADLLEVVI